MNGTFTFEYEARPWTHNAERGMHHMDRARLIREWREAFGWLARQKRTPQLRSAAVTVQPWCENAKSLPDVGACAPAAKAAIDGLVDAGVIADDDPSHLTSLTLVAARSLIIDMDARKRQRESALMALDSDPKFEEKQRLEELEALVATHQEALVNAWTAIEQLQAHARGEMGATSALGGAGKVRVT